MGIGRPFFCGGPARGIILDGPPPYPRGGGGPWPRVCDIPAIAPGGLIPGGICIGICIDIAPPNGIGIPRAGGPPARGATIPGGIPGDIGRAPGRAMLIRGPWSNLLGRTIPPGPWP